MKTNLLQEFIVHNQSELEDLVWEINTARGQFSLTLVRCNYTSLCDHLLTSLHQLYQVDLRVLVLQPSEVSLYTCIQTELSGDIPDSLLILGLDQVEDLEQLFATANQVREEFRKNCPFPIIVWVTDDVLKLLVKSAPDLESWTTKTYFTLPLEILEQALQEATDSLFDKLLIPITHEDFNDIRSNLSLGLLHPKEIEVAKQEIQAQGHMLEAALQASLAFVIGLQMENPPESLSLFKESLTFWQEANLSSINSADREQLKLKLGLLLFYVGQCHYSIADENPYQKYDWGAIRELFQNSINQFEQTNRLDLVALVIPQIERVLQKLQIWDELEKIAFRGIELHRIYRFPTRLSQDYGFLAQVALGRKQWQVALKQAQQALKELPAESDRSWLKGLYRLFIAQAERQLGYIQEAIHQLLEADARKVSDQGYPKIAIQILRELREIYFEQKQYLEAFQIRQELLSIEQQYGIRGFIGAGQLRSHRQESMNELLTSPKETIAMEIVASGRQQELDSLTKLIGGTDCQLIVIHGYSGVGKSSLVNAGLIPVLEKKTIGIRSYCPVVLREYKRWIQDLGRLLFAKTNEFIDIDNNPEILLSQIRQLDSRNLKVVLIFDQFEEFFVDYPKAEQRTAFFDFLSACLQILSLKVLLVLREDYLHQLLELNRLPAMQRRGIDVLSKNVLFEVKNFSPEDATNIILSVSERSKFHIEADLVEQLVVDLQHDTLGTVRPIELQIVGFQLQNDSPPISTLSQYRSLGEKPKEKLVQRYLEQVVADCGEEHRKIAEQVLYSLTSRNGNRIVKTRGELERELYIIPKDKIVHSLDLVLQIFVGSGLVILLPDIPDEHFQLVHDYLANLIRQQYEKEIEKSNQVKLIVSSHINNIRKAQKQDSGKKKFLKAMVCATLSAAFTFGLDQLNILKILEYSSYNWFLNIRGSISWDKRIVLITIDDTSLKKFSDPKTYYVERLPRKEFAKLLKFLTKAKHSVVVIDSLMKYPSNDDKVLKDAIKEHGNVVLPFASNEKGIMVMPNRPFDEEISDSGHSFKNLDLDGIQRDAQLQIKLKDKSLESNLSVAAVRAFARYDSKLKQNIPPYIKNTLWINWPSSSVQMPQYSFIEVINEKVPISEFENKIVLVGYTVSGFDELRTPYDEKGYGVYLHAAIINTLLQKNSLHRPSKEFLILILLISGYSLIVIISRLDIRIWLFVLIVSCVIWLLISYFLFSMNYWFPIVSPIVTLILTGSIMLVIELHEKKLDALMNQQIVDLIEKYGTPEWADRILKSAIIDFKPDGLNNKLYK